MCADKNMLNSFDPEKSNSLSDEDQTLLKKRQQLLSPSYRLFYDNPLHLVKGEGVWLYDNQGNRYLDTYNNVVSVGHANPKVVEAIASQAAQLNTHTRYLHHGIVDYAEKLLATFPSPLSQVLFTCTGSEANDVALRVARFHTKGTGIIVTKLAYHGVTAAVSEVSPSLGESVPLHHGVRTVNAPDVYRNTPQQAEEQFLSEIKAAIKDMRRHGIKPAALLVDTLFTSDGIYSHPVGILAKAAELIQEAGGLFIADEVQAGFGRSGEQMWGFQRHNLVPDIVTMGKPMANGHPVAAVVAKPEILEAFGKESRYFNTFGGNPVSCAAAMATLEYIESENLLSRVSAVGERMRQGFNSLAQDFELIGDVRGAGSFVGVELVLDREQKTPAKAETGRFVNMMREQGVLLSATGTLGNVLKIRPPLVFEEEHVDILIDKARQVFSSL